MEKITKYILIIFILLFVPNFVSAGEEEKIVENERTVCMYYNKLKNGKADHRIIVTNRTVKAPEGDYIEWQVSATEMQNMKTVVKDWSDFNSVFSASGSPNIYIDEALIGSFRSTWECPKNGYLDTDFFNEICFDNDGKYCTNISGFGTHFANDEESKTTESIKAYDAKELVVDASNKDGIDIAEKTTIQEYHKGITGQKIVEATNNNINIVLEGATEAVKKNLVEEHGDEIINGAGQVIVSRKDEFENDVEEDYNNGKITKEEHDILSNVIKNELSYDTIMNHLNTQLYNGIVAPSGIIPINTDCEFFLGSPREKDTPAWYLVKAFSILKYIAIVILIVLSVVDLVGATASKDQDNVKKAVNKVLIRLILCIVIFLLPTLLKFVLQIIFENVDMCGI